MVTIVYVKNAETKRPKINDCGLGILFSNKEVI